MDHVHLKSLLHHKFLLVRTQPDLLCWRFVVTSYHKNDGDIDKDVVCQRTSANANCLLCAFSILTYRLWRSFNNPGPNMEQNVSASMLRALFVCGIAAVSYLLCSRFALSNGLTIVCSTINALQQTQRMFICVLCMYVCL